jgi:hypothetical protein
MIPHPRIAASIFQSSTTTSLTSFDGSGGDIIPPPSRYSIPRIDPLQIPAHSQDRCHQKSIAIGPIRVLDFCLVATAPGASSGDVGRDYHSIDLIAVRLGLCGKSVSTSRFR